eukprot:NODE_4796_length_640_cov_317.148718.p4 GENE.NODE_4796_length_640_cov_317.148718~~NODE_4796_length_640_cov_317.148718.p4  ORF type:complete len:63 (+),score=8.86 NODE_4796_length_640_cov_317.148718:3-191(+)
MGRCAAVEGLRVLAEKADAGTGTRARIMSAIEAFVPVAKSQKRWIAHNWAVHVLEVLRGGLQ